MSSIDKTILPPGTTMVLRLEMKEFFIIANRHGKSTLNFFGSRKRMTTKLSSAVGMSRAINGFEVDDRYHSDQQIRVLCNIAGLGHHRAVQPLVKQQIRVALEGPPWRKCPGRAIVQ
jgi:hypothetical protein